jgi:biotin carboxylase
LTGKRAERLIVSYDTRTPSAFTLAEVARGLCKIIWMVDLSDPEMAHFAPLLRRLGTVVDIARLTLAQTVQVLGAEEPKGIITMNDSRMALLAAIASRLGLEFHSPEIAALLSDKLLQRQAMHAAGLPGPPFWEVPEGLDRAGLEVFAREVRFPAILKPRRGAGSSNVRQVHDAEELARLVAVPGDPQRERTRWILEGYLRGAGGPDARFADVVSTESFVQEGVVHQFAVTGRFPFAHPFRETGMVLPADVSPAEARAVQDLAAAAIGALGVGHGCQHTEVKFTPDGPYIVEVNGRLGGAVPQLVTLAGGGISVFRIAMELALGMPVTVELPLSFPRIAYRRIAPPPVWARRVATMAGQEHLRELPGVVEVTFNRLPGDPVDWHLGLGQFVYGVYGTAESYEEVEANCALFDRTVAVTYDDSRS